LGCRRKQIGLGDQLRGMEGDQAASRINEPLAKGDKLSVASMSEPINLESRSDRKLLA